MKSGITSVCVFILTVALSAGTAEGAGIINVTIMNRDSSGIETALPYAYLYLQPGSQEPPREKYFVNAAYIFGPSDAYGRISAGVPEGTYYIRVTARNPSANRPYGPPDPADHTWSQTNTITVTPDTVTDLGTKYASPFGSAPIVISGIVRKYDGTPLADRYVRAQVEPCLQANGAQGIATNRCGSEKHLAARTDANGKYTLYLKSPGTFHMYTSRCLGDQHQEYQGNPCIGKYGGTLTVNATDSKAFNFVYYSFEQD